MVEQVFSGVDLAHGAPTRRCRGARRVQRLAADLRSRFAEHPGAIVLVASGPLDGRQALSFGETLLEGFTSEGMPLADAARATAAVRAYVIGAHHARRLRRRGRHRMPQDAPAPLWTEATQHPLTEAARLLAADDAGDPFATRASTACSTGFGTAASGEAAAPRRRDTPRRPAHDGDEAPTPKGRRLVVASARISPGEE